MGEVTQSGAVVLDTPEDIAFFRLLALKGALGLELKGLRRSRGPSAYKIAKQSYGLTGNKQKVYDQLVAMIEQIQEKHDAESVGA